MADVIKMGHSATKITDKSGPTLFLIATFSFSMESEVPIMSFLDFRVPTFVLLAKPLFSCVYCTRYPSAEPRSLVFRRAQVLMFTCSRLLCHLGRKCFSIWFAAMSPRS